MTDDSSGVDFVYANFESPSGYQQAEAGVSSESFDRISGTAQDGIYQGTMTIPTGSESRRSLFRI